MSAIVQVLIDYGFELALALTIVMAVGAFAVRVSRSPVQRHRLVEWTLGIALVVAPLLLVPIPRLHSNATNRIELALNAPVHESAIASELESLVTAVREEEALGESATFVPMEESTAQLPMDSFEPAFVAAPIVFQHVAEPAVAPMAGEWICIGFLVGAVGFALHLLVSLGLLNRLVRRAHAAPDWVVELVSDIESTSVVVSSESKRPFCFGFGPGTIVLPAELVDQRNERRLRVVLLHERAHLSQHHGRARMIAALATPLFYWQPLFWWLTRAARNDAELVADDVASGSMNKRDYALELLELVESTQRAGLAGALSLGALSSRSHFLERMETLLKRTQPLTIPETRLHQFARTTLGFVLLAGVSLAWGRTPQSTAQETTELPSEPISQESTLSVHEAELRARDAEVLEILSSRIEMPLKVLPVDSDRYTIELAGRETEPETEDRKAESVIEFRMVDLDQLRHFTNRIADAGGEFQLIQVRNIGGDDRRVEGSGRLLRLSTEQRNNLQQFLEGYEEKKREGRTDPRHSIASKELAALDEEIRALTSRLAVLRMRRNALEDAMALEAAREGAQTSGRTVDFRLLPSAAGDLVGVVDNAKTTGKLVAIEKSENGHYYAVFNRGEAQGVTMETLFDVYRGSDYKGRVQVTSVSDNYCVGKLPAGHEGMSVGDSATTDL